jgi:RimJ/RimL family protein N-acetyltransferase
MTPIVIRVPEIQTGRLLLRPFGVGDVEPYIAMVTDPEVARFLGDGTPPSRAEAWRQLAMIMGHWALRGHGLWAVEEVDTHTLVGRIGLWEPEGWLGFELAYTVARPFWGRGFAREGAGAALRFAREVMGRHDVISIIRPANTRSASVATSLGAARAESREFMGAPSDIYRYSAG